MKRVLLGVVAAAAAFVLVAAPSGVLGMIDEDYCIDHGDRPREATSHEESISLFPPGPVCTFFTPEGPAARAGPGWWPATAAAAAALAGLAAVRVPH